VSTVPRWIEVRTPGLTRRYLIDYDRIYNHRMTWEAYCVAGAHGIMSLRAKLIEDAILDGHDRIEVQVEGDSTTVHFCPDWFSETRAWLRVWWARRRHRRSAPPPPPPRDPGKPTR